MKKLALIFILIISISFAYAEIQTLPPQRQGSCVNIPQTCANCTFVNVTAVKFPNSTLEYIDTSMTKVGANFNYSFCSTKDLGSYIVTTCGDIDGVYTCVDYDFPVTPTGTENSTSKAITYILIFILAFIVFSFLLWFGIAMPSKNKSDEMTGYIIAVSNLKYVKMLFLALSYIAALVIVYFAWMICFSFLEFNFLSSIFQFAFYGMAIATLPLFIVGVVIVISNAVRDAKIAEMLSLGVRTRE